ncbi:MAG: hypothetical protein LW630_00315 [Saprospiraceae bacterium]|nr:hypothetical protein [Saprospiraceae bacterium]
MSSASSGRSLEKELPSNKQGGTEILTENTDSALYMQKARQLMLTDTLIPDTPATFLPVPVCDAILPFNRIVAMYGNFYSSHMGILGSLDEDELLKLLDSESESWNQADPLTPVMPAIHYIAVTAQKSPGKGKKYRLRMPAHQMNKAIRLARKAEGITFLDIQVGHSTVRDELSLLREYLMMPDVHLALDPEWSMRDGSVPGSKIGSMHADDINYASKWLAALVKKHRLPPKILVVHRFTEGMIEDYRKIQKNKHVQIVINMDGFGFPAKKKHTYKNVVGRKPIQFTGFKLFYQNDKKDPPYRLLSHEEILQLHPKPLYIQYQ